jgi:hypothetical protein
MIQFGNDFIKIGSKRIFIDSRVRKFKKNTKIKEKMNYSKVKNGYGIYSMVVEI